ncbi:inorganic phosphate transporter [Puia dinghuensis]|uniref:Inorganic phosphate transporter n=1 Tax=Puia dinghuensis TaxID=1792502 RepID=A0A8J2XTX9_9BACT|nr:inorganic phosphate transporter [Puia dinghuensis]GGB07535.1 inorganic phosphate transporter [Puia dinghuensis]
MILLFTIIALALIFDYINGFHDAALSIATIVSTKVLTPFQAVLWAAIFNFAAYFLFSNFIGEYKIAGTVAHFVNRDFITLPVILSGLIAAITWNLFTWWFGIPSSSSHTLLGGFVGAALAHAGGWAVHGEHVIDYGSVIPTFLFIVFAPLIGMFVALVITILVINLFQRSNPYKADGWFRRMQLVSSALLSLGHGGNDAQKVLGIIAAAMAAHGDVDNIKHIPDWVPVACFSVIALGTMSGGWRIAKTMGKRITKTSPMEGVCAELAGATTLALTQYLGIPVSTTHTITGSIVGVGATKRMSAVRWGVTINLIWAWVLTIPVSALLAALVYWIVRLFL